MTPKTKEQFEEIRKEKHELIKETALHIFAEKGYQATTISEIAKAANISKGLLYNYFESKESLLTNILEDFIKNIGNLINPNSDDEITNEEMENYFDLLIESMKTEREYWMIFFQLTMQKDVVSHIFSKEGTGVHAEKNLQLAYKYFAERFENPQEEMLLFRSIIKGLALILIYTPEACPDDVVDSLKKRLKDMFVKPKKSK